MQQNYPFKPRGGGYTTSLPVTATAQPLNLPITMPQEGCNLRLANIGTQTVYVTFTGAATVANGMPLEPNTVEMFSIGPGDAISAIAAATGSTLYATMGDGQ